METNDASHLAKTKKINELLLNENKEDAREKQKFESDVEMAWHTKAVPQVRNWSVPRAKD
jgi:hypothetical protein